MIRSQASGKPFKPNLAPGQPKASQYPSGSKGKPAANPEYDYLVALSHPEQYRSQQSSSDTNYYLALASNARQNRHWASVELYYKLAWESLPENRKKSVLKSLEEARNTKGHQRSQNQVISVCGCNHVDSPQTCLQRSQSFSLHPYGALSAGIRFPLSSDFTQPIRTHFKLVAQSMQKI